MTSQEEKAEAFRELHHKDRILILPNAWDVPSARVFENEGFPAVATSSAAVMVSLGYPDGELISRHEYLAAVKRIAKVLSIPLSADAVAGFGRTSAEVASTARGLIRAGAVGLNIEDFEHSTKRLFTARSHVEKIKAIKKTGEAMRVPLVINARTDALRYATGGSSARFNEAVDRAISYRDAGADCVYPMGLVDLDQISSFVRALDFPVNVMVRKGLPPVKDLERAGVKRLSFGPSASYAALGLLRRISKEVWGTGTYGSLLEGVLTFDELNSLAVPKA